MDKNRANPMIWEEEGVHAYVPDQDTREIVPDIREKLYAKPPDVSNFRVIRHLVNFCVKDEDTGEYIEYFSPPLRITVCYTQDDVDDAGGVKHLKLRAWINGRWWRLPITKRDATCPLENTDHVGAFKVLITGRWADPEIAWGT